MCTFVAIRACLQKETLLIPEICLPYLIIVCLNDVLLVNKSVCLLVCLVSCHTLQLYTETKQWFVYFHSPEIIVMISWT